jgi:glucosamine-6-phosphate deaminase
METPLRLCTANRASVRVYSSKSQLGKAAALDAGELMRDAISRQGHVRIIVATGNSQTDFIKALTTDENLDWKMVEVFHMDGVTDIAVTAIA